MFIFFFCSFWKKRKVIPLPVKTIPNEKREVVVVCVWCIAVFYLCTEGHGRRCVTVTAQLYWLVYFHYSQSRFTPISQTRPIGWMFQRFTLYNWICGKHGICVALFSKFNWPSALHIRRCMGHCVLMDVCHNQSQRKGEKCIPMAAHDLTTRLIYCCCPGYSKCRVRCMYMRLSD